MALVVANACLIAMTVTGNPWIHAGSAIAPLFLGMWGELTWKTQKALRKG